MIQNNKIKPYRIYRYQYGRLKSVFGAYDTFGQAFHDWEEKLRNHPIKSEPPEQYIFVHYSTTMINGSKIIGYGTSNRDFWHISTYFIIKNDPK